MRSSCLVIAFLVSASSWAADASGYYASASSQGPTWRELCITQGGKGLFEVTAYTAYCPSDECLNVRIDTLEFQAKLQRDGLHYASPGCAVDIFFEGERAEVRQKGSSCGEDRRLLAAGQYERRAREVPQGACTAQGVQAQ